MNYNIAILNDFCALTGLKVHARKCFGFMLSPGKHSKGRMRINDCPPWKIGGVPIDMVESERTVKYLGIQVGPTRGVEKPDALAELKAALEKVEATPLTAPQKVWLVKSFVIPRLFYRADHCDYGSVLTRSLDQLLRGKIKKWLGLPGATCNGLLYTRAREGGLGVQKLGAVIPAMQAKRLWKLLHSEDRVIREIAWLCKGHEAWKDAWQRAGGKTEDRPTPKRRADGEGTEDEPLPKWKRPCDWQAVEFKAWADKPVQGMGITWFKEAPESNAWLRDLPKVQSRFCTQALLLRANVYPTREFMARGLPKHNARCRGCNARLESSSHILGACRVVTTKRVERHNFVCQRLALVAKKLGWTVSREKCFGDRSALKRPDLVMCKDDKAIVLDVTVRYELNVDTLKKAYKDKVKHYRSIKDLVMASMGVSKVEIHGFPLGSRGLWYRPNGKILRKLGLSRQDTKSLAERLCKGVLRGSLSIMSELLQCKNKK